MNGNSLSDVGNKKPAFSVIIPTYNRADFLPRAIQSILKQTFRDFELIIVDDGSTDNTEEVVGGISNARVRYFYQQNRGVSAARNFGATLSKGQYTTFLDSDDEVLPEWLQHFADAFHEQNAGVVCCGVTVIEEGNTIIGF